MSQSQVLSFRASGHFLNRIEAQRLEGESVSQAAQRILKEISGTSTTMSTVSTQDDATALSTVSTDLSTRNNNSVVSTALSTAMAETVDKAVADRLDPVMERMAAIEERLGKLSALSDGNDESLRQELKVANKQLAEWDTELNQLHERNGDIGLKAQMLEQELKEVRRDQEANKNSAPTVAKFPEPADLLNELKARRKKSRADFADVGTFLEILGLES
ncbi:MULTISPECIES: hypothetical protein [unclassified Microcoleus]|uniref:hypothetical protein n=1 Tax=unclassified Microcoleus TaxID=2642155 RepID=UPI00403F5EFA